MHMFHIEIECIRECFVFSSHELPMVPAVPNVQEVQVELTTIVDSCGSIYQDISLVNQISGFIMEGQESITMFFGPVQ